MLYSDDMAKIILNFIHLNDELFIKSSLTPYIIGNSEILTTDIIIEIINNKLKI